MSFFVILSTTSKDISILSAQHCRAGHSDQNDVLHDIKQLIFHMLIAGVIVARHLYIGIIHHT